MFKTISSKTALLITLAVSLLALTALAVWAQAAQAQSSVVRVDSMRQMFGDHDDDDGDDDATAHLSYLEIDISVSGVNRLAPADEGSGSYGDYPIKSVEDRADCNEDDFSDADKATVFTAAAIGSEAFKIKSGVTGNYDDDADEIFTVIQAPDTHHERYLCVEISYLDDDEDVQVDYAASSTMLDLEAPIVEEVVVNDDARNQEYGLGENIDIMVEFDARVQIRKISDHTGDDLDRPFIAVPGLGNAELISLGSGTVLTFRYTVEFGDENADLADPASFVITMGNDYRITDTAGNPIAEGDTATIAEEIDFRGGEIAVELDVRAVRMDDRLVIKATPDKYDDGNDDLLTVASAIAYSSEDAPDVRSNEDPCEDGVIADGGVIYDNAADKSGDSDYFGTDLPDETDDEYYCFKVVDAASRTVYTNVYRYATDNTSPRIGFAYEDNILTITASDPESGIDESTLAWFWSEIAADNVNKSCNSRTVESEFNQDGEDGMIEITIKASYSGDKICVRVENGEGDQSIVEQPLSYVDPGTVDPGTTDPGTTDPGTTDPGTTDPGTTDPGTTTGTGTVKVPKTWPGQAVWASWTTEKVTMNPWGCLDTTKIRGDNGQCISGGTSLTDGDYVYVNSLADAGSSSTTTAPGPGTTTPPTTPDPGTTTPPTTPDPGTTTPPTTPDPDPTTTPDPDSETVDAGTITLNYDYAESMITVEVSVDDKLTNVRYVVQEESGQCNAEGVADATHMDVADDAIEVTDEDATNGRYVCVFATSSELDEDDAPIVVYQPQQVGEDATSGDDEETPPADDEDGGNGIWIIVGIVAVAIVGVVVVLVFLGKRNQ